MRTSRAGRWPASLLLLAGLGALPCTGDTITLENGDHLTGEVQELKESRLVLKTRCAGVLKVDWKMVESVSTEHPVRVETGSGLRVTGFLRGTPEALDVISGGRAVQVSPPDVVAITPLPAELREGFWNRLEGTSEIGYSLARGNSQLNQSSLGLQARYRAEKYKGSLNITSLFSRQSGAPTTSDHRGTFRFDYYLSPRAFTFALTGLERSDRHARAAGQPLHVGPPPVRPLRQQTSHPSAAERLWPDQQLRVELLTYPVDAVCAAGIVWIRCAAQSRRLHRRARQPTS